MSTFTPNREHIKEEAAVECDNCDWTGEFTQLNEIKDPHERMDPGCPIPAGECPKCGALAYLTESPDFAPKQLNRAYLESLRNKAQLYLQSMGPYSSAEANSAVGRAFRKGLAAGTIKVVEMILEEHGIFLSDPPDVNAAFKELLEALKEVPQPPRQKKKRKK